MMLMLMSLILAGCISAKAVESVDRLDDFSQLDAWKVWPEAWGGKAGFGEASGPDEGTYAIRFTGPGIVYRELTDSDTGAWQRSTGLSFWVKGDGSPLYGTLVVGPAGKGTWQQGFVKAGMTGHAFYFPLANTNWHRVTAAWSDFIPEGPHPVIGATDGLAPADIRVLRIGNRWKYWRNYNKYPRFSYEIASIELVKIPGRREAVVVSSSPPEDELPALEIRPAVPIATVATVLGKMRSGEPVRILCAGDSITAGAGLRGGRHYWVLLQALLQEAFGNEWITVEGWGIGGATLLDSLPWIEWMLGKEPPDLVTVMFGTNDCSCYPPDYFRWCLEQFLDRTAHASGGQTAVLPFATLPGLKEYLTKTDPYAEAVRAVMRERQQPFLDLSLAFKAQTDAAYAACFADGVHLNATGHEFVARTVADYLVCDKSDETIMPSQTVDRLDQLQNGSESSLASGGEVARP